MNKAPYANCDVCPLKEYDFVPPCGPKTYTKAIVGEAPGVQEVRKGRPFVGKAGKLLESAILNYTDLEWDGIHFTNAVLCRPPKNAAPSVEAIAACRPRLTREIELNADILLAGKAAMQAVLGYEGGVGTIRGGWINNYLPTWHPAYILRSPNQARDFLRDIRKFGEGPQEQILSIETYPTYNVIDNPQDLKNLLGHRARMEFTWDYETSQTHWPSDYILMMGLAFGPEHAYILTDDVFYDQPESIEILNRFFKDNYAIAHNGKFDTMFARKVGLDKARVDFDTLLANYALDERGIGVHGLKKLGREHFDLPDWDLPYKRWMRSKNDDWSKIPFEEMAPYCAMDVCVTYELKQDLQEQLKREGLYERPFMETIMPIADLATEMEWRGMMVDVPHLKYWKGRLEQEKAHYLEILRDISGKPELNPNSPKQLAVVIYDERGLKQPPHKTWDKIKGQVNINPRSTSEVALFHLATVVDGEVQGFEDPFLDNMFKYRRVNKILRTYVDRILDRRDSNDRYHDDIKVFGTETGRLATYLHTIPRDYDIYGRIVRSAFIPPPGSVYIRADYSQAELRSAGAVSGDPFIAEVYREGRDLHSEVCEAVFGPDWGTEQRIIIKRLNFAYVYGGGRAALVSDTNIPKDESHRIMSMYEAKMVGLTAWKAKQIHFLEDNGYIETPFGRRRRFPYMNNRNYKEAQKAAVNVPIQSAASDITHLSAIEVQKRYPVVLTKHDELICEVPATEAEEAMAWVEKTMEETGDKWLPQITWKADASIKHRWTELPPRS